MPETGGDSTGVGKSAHRGTTSLIGCASCKGCTISPSQYIYRDTTWYYWLCHYQVRFLVDDRYDSQELVIYWGFKDIKEWCQLKPRSLQAAVGYPMDTGR